MDDRYLINLHGGPDSYGTVFTDEIAKVIKKVRGKCPTMADLCATIAAKRFELSTKRDIDTINKMIDVLNADVIVNNPDDATVYYDRMERTLEVDLKFELDFLSSDEGDAFSDVCRANGFNEHETMFGGDEDRFNGFERAEMGEAQGGTVIVMFTFRYDF